LKTLRLQLTVHLATVPLGLENPVTDAVNAHSGNNCRVLRNILAVEHTYFIASQDRNSPNFILMKFRGSTVLLLNTFGYISFLFVLYGMLIKNIVLEISASFHFRIRDNFRTADERAAD
jgi:hypothetical protein